MTPYKGYYIRASISSGKAGKQSKTTSFWVIKMDGGIAGGHTVLKRAGYPVGDRKAKAEAFKKCQYFIDTLT